MQRFDAADAAFFGFGLIKRDPTQVIALALIYALMTVGAWYFMIEPLAVMMGSGMAEDDPTEMMIALGQFYGALAPIFLVTALFSLVIQGAVLRNLVREERGGWVFGLQFAGDELRLLLVNIVVYLLVFLVYIAVIAVTAGVAAGLGAVNGALAGVAAVVLGVAGLCVLITVAVRLSPAAAATIGDQKLVVFRAWSFTKGKFWGLFGAYVIAFIIALVLALVVFAITAIAAPNYGAMMMDPSHGSVDPQELVASLRSPAFFLTQGIAGAVNIIGVLLLSGVGAYAYRTLGTGGAPAAPAAAPTPSQPQGTV